MKNNFQSKSVPRGTRTIWRYLGALFLLFTFAIGNVWGAETILATFRVNLDADPTGKYASYSDADADYTCNKVGSNSSSNYAKVGTQYYMKLTANDAYVKIKLKTGSIAAGDKVYVYHNHTTNKNGVGFAMTQGGTNGATGNATANTEFKLSYTLTDSDIAADGSISVYRQGSNLYVGRIEVAHPEPECDKPETPADLAVDSKTYNSASFSWSAAANSDGYKVYVEKKSDKSKILDWTTCATTSYTATGLAAETEYTFKVKAIGTSGYCELGDEATVDVTTNAAPAVCPSGLTISGTAAYTEGETISLTAALEAGNGGITYTWYKGSIAAGNEVGTGASFSKANCVAGDAGDYFCVASKDACASAESAAYAVTVAPIVACYTFTATLPAETVTFAVNDIVPGSTGGSIKVLGNTMKNTAYGLSFESSGSAKVGVTLNSLMKKGTKITATVWSNNTSSARSLKLNTSADATKATWSFTPSTAEGEEKVFTYTVTDGDGLIGTNVFNLQRGSNIYLKSLTVSNCGAELVYYGLTSAVVPSGKGTVTLSASSLLEGETATATYAISDENYEFDEWQISGTDATLSGAEGDHVTVTMGSTDAVVTLKLKEKAGFAVTYKANNGTEEADVVVSKENTFAANTFTAPEGKMFAGWNTQADGEGTNYAVGAAVEAATTVYAKWVIDPTIRLIKKVGEEYVLNTTDFEFNSAKTKLQTADYTVEDVVYPKNVKLGGTATAVTGINADKYIAYHTKTNSTHVEIALYDAYSSNTTHNVYIARVKEGNGTPEIETVAIVTGTKRDYYKSYDLTGRTSLYIYVGNDNARVCQVFVTENGEPNVADAPAEGYSINLNKGRMFAASGVAKSFEGLTYVVAEDYQPTNRTALKIKTQNTHYISFEIPTGQTRQLQLTASGSYNVSKTLGDESAYVSGNQNINLTEGAWYINPNGSNVSITNITFAAAPDPLTVTFKDGESTLSEQALFVGDKVAEPEAPTKTGYRFDKWQKSGVDYDFDYTLVAGDAPGFTLDAVWQKTWKVTFDADNGSDPVVVTVDNNQAVAQPVNPEKAGFDFVEWQLSGSAYNFATLVTDDIILKAKWEVAQDDATISALSYNGNAIDVASAEEVSGVQTYTYHLPWGSTIDPALVSVTKNAETATVGSITYDSENNRISFAVESGNHSVLINYAIQFVIDAKRGTSIIKATTNNVVTGLIGGTRTTNLGDGNAKKLNGSTYFGVTLANDETFQEGDVFIVNITTAADLGKFMVYADKDRTVLVADQGVVYTKPDVADPVICPTGEMMMTLPAAANGKKSLYLSREDGTTQWNPTFSYIEVTREMNPAIKSFKFGDDAATINESAKTISIDVPYGTAVTALTPTVEAYGNNGATYTPSGATDFTSPVVYTVTDAYNELHTDYTVTVNIAAPSTNAYLASLSVAGYALDFDKEVESYNIVLDYGTTVLPEITYAVEDAGLATAVKVEGGVNGATTITVTPQAGESYKKVYTINFSVSTTPKYVIYDGSTMTNIASATGADGSTGFSYSLASNIPLSGDAISSSWGGKDYTHAIKGFKPNDNSSNIVSFVIPEGYVAKVRLVGSTNSNTKERKLFIAMSASKDAADALNNYIITSSTYDAQGFVTDYLLPNTYYLGSTDSYRLFEFSIQLYPIDEARAMTQGRFGTICYPKGGRLLGAMLLEIAYFDPDQKKIFFDEVIGGQMVAGAPYLFLPDEGVDKFAIVYTDNVDAPAGHHNGLYGSYTQEALPTDGNHYIMLNNQYCKVVEANTYVGANRAYIKLDKIGNDYVAPAYGRRRVSLGVQQAEVATGLEDLNVGDQPIKIMINGQMYILRGEKMFDATGRLVK